MSSTWKYVEKCTILNDMAEGLLSRLYNAKKSFADPATCPPCLASKDLSKIRDKLEKSFPDSADLTKLSGYESLRSGCAVIASDLSFFNEIILDVSDFRKAALFLLKDIAASTLQFFKLDKHRPIILLFFQLLTGLFRVLTLASTVQERKSVIALYTTANSMASDQTDVVGVSDAVVLFSALAHGPRLFVDEFYLHSEFIGNLLLELAESLSVSANTENLRSKNVLNPSNDGDIMTHPAKTTLNARPDRVLSMYSELRDASLYHEYAALGFLLCPSLLLHPDGKYLDLFRLVLCDQLVVTLYRELNINIHAELETMYSNYPSKKDTINVPKGFKVKSVLKEVATTAVQTVGLKHRERRSFLLAEVKNLLNIVHAVPGLIGPKFPQVVTAAAMAKAEIMHYFRHRQMECRKDMKKVLVNEDYYCPRITLLIEALYELSCVVEEYREVVTMYYSEYLSLIDAPTLQTLCAEAAEELPETANPALHTLLLSLPLCARNAAHTAHTNTEECGPEEDLTLGALRVNWDRYSTLLGTVWGKFSGPSNAGLTLAMAEVRDRSECVDDVSGLLKKYFLPSELWWHSDAMCEAFERGFEHNAKPLCFFPTLSLVSLNVHTDNILEAKELSRLAWKFCDRLMSKFSSHLTEDLDVYWSLFNELEKKTLGKEAMKRLEKQYFVKQARDRALASGKKDPNVDQPEQHPGYESEGWASEHIAPLVAVRTGLLHLMAAVKGTGTFFIFDREYNIEFALRDAFSYYFSSKMKKIISQKEEISRPSLILQNVVVGCRVMQSLCNIVSFDLPLLLRTFLFDNFCDAAVPPPGMVLSSHALLSSTGDSQEGLVWVLGRWFIQFVEEASAQNSGLMWVPATRTFARADSKQRPVDIFLNREELKCLCSLIGPQGVRCIDSLLVKVVADKVATVKSFIALNKKVLKQFSGGDMIHTAHVSNMESSAGFMTATVKAGVALALREMLHLGLSDSMQIYAPFLKASVASVAASVNPWAERDVSTPLYSLAYDAGVVPEVDLSLVASLSPLMKTAEERENLTLLPAAFAACFVLPYWTQNSIFLPEFGAFRGNQHAIALTMSKLILCFTDPMEESFPKAVQQRAHSFLELSAGMILTMRQQGPTYHSHPIRAYTNILELFLRYCPLTDHYSLEKFLPYAFVHASQMELSMGQVKGVDSITAGMNRVIKASAE